MRLTLIAAVAILGIACGSSPSSPSDDGPTDLVLSNFRVSSSGHFAGTGPIYSLCGNITVAQSVTETVVLHDLVLTIRDASGQTLLTWSDPTIFTRLDGGGLFGCFGAPTDPDPTHGLGSTFVARITYSRVTGPSRVIEASGSITGSP